MSPKTMDLYDRQLANYRAALEKDPEAALAQYGMSMINSLSPAERALAMKKFGFEITEAVDFYNLGVHFAQQENWGEAIDYFKKALEIDPELNDAVYNLALCYEKTGHVPQAKQVWDIYLKSVEDGSERHKVEQHIASLD